MALAAGGLDQLVHTRGADGRQANLRRLVCDLIEEYGRHTGHADLLREAVDGLVARIRQPVGALGPATTDCPADGVPTGGLRHRQCSPYEAHGPRPGRLRPGREPLVTGLAPRCDAVHYPARARPPSNPRFGGSVAHAPVPPVDH
ncbi:Protein of unknown function [Micromonospora phaseoli]|uniref:DUF664 domain-containing protein n=1 Tax=Micromonospora phaseoli TaxID=1144548 RepID=A0A1H6W5W1_9ACTN|nr:DUF664 domain-containing protein [Micromonospora phaseoli]PZW01664.1 uncharacterized protein DUF664 [Micromonospora phaseoli]GIJ80691.1 hypothetical protein Xph01_51230 [Micromonospora phaseoli]SEJ12293.1 Protein of unknown function [Micromonospora phaseoli]